MFGWCQSIRGSWMRLMSVDAVCGLSAMIWSVSRVAAPISAERTWRTTIGVKCVKAKTYEASAVSSDFCEHLTFMSLWRSAEGGPLSACSHIYYKIYQYEELCWLQRQELYFVFKPNIRYTFAKKKKNVFLYSFKWFMQMHTNKKISHSDTSTAIVYTL